MLLALVLVLLNIVPLGIDVLARAPHEQDSSAAADRASKPCGGCDDDGDAPCPPACPDCVYSSPGVRLVAPSTPSIALAPALALLPTAMPSAAQGFDLTGPPRAPCLSGVFHPPRA